jgi:hypothetical protein
MEKKFYLEPEEMIVELNMKTVILAGSDGSEEGDPIPQGGGEGEDTPGGW